MISKAPVAIKAAAEVAWRKGSHLQVIEQDACHGLLDVQGQQRVLDQDYFSRLGIGQEGTSIKVRQVGAESI